MAASRWAVRVAVVVLLALAGRAVFMAVAESSARERGGHLFGGEPALVGRITGQAVALPLGATRCSNCHATGPAAPGAKAGFGPELSPRTLMASRVRRGGPASRFDETGLCRLLRDGVDPAFIVIAQAMPRYEVSPAECRDLWAYLSRVE